MYILFLYVIFLTPQQYPFESLQFKTLGWIIYRCFIDNELTWLYCGGCVRRLITMVTVRVNRNRKRAKYM